MTYIINESKRDDLLLPYFEKVRAEYPDLTLGKFKGMMLDKLAAQGGLNNLSLSSNYYLAGATRYYFNGDLTVDHQIHFDTANDKWNVEVCKRLNALIMVLRDAYIDTIGTTFEQPEDFGTLSLPKLLRKYNKKINAVLGIEDEPKKKSDAPAIDTNPRVGNGYTFDILYDYPDATKYNQYTSPGAWCITYAQHHFNHYVRSLGIHYVIFLKDGYENVKRPRVPVNFRKPHDEYGNSMIAFLQSNKGPEGIYITSRWNHGYGESSGTEADHAYTMDEFMKITGVTPEDLKRIYDIWKINAPKRAGNGADRSRATRLKKELIHKMKYAQMRINGGEDPVNFFKFSKLLSGKLENGPRKTVCVASPRTSYFGEEWNGEFRPQFIIDKGTILFDTMTWGHGGWPEINAAENLFDTKEKSGATIFRNCAMCTDNTGTIIYDMRRKQPISIDGITKFKYVPKRWSPDVAEEDFAIVKMASQTIALIDMKTNQPLRLPNGEYWFNNMVTRRNYSFGRNTDCSFVDKQNDPFLEIVYDNSSGEKYFFNTATRRWVTPPSCEESLGLSGQYVANLVYGDLISNGLTVIAYEPKNRRGWGETAGEVILDGNFNKVSIGRWDKFKFLSRDDNIVSFAPFEGQMPSMDEIFIERPCEPELNHNFIYNQEDNMILKINGKYLLSDGVKNYGSARYVIEDCGYVPISVNIPGTNGRGSVHPLYYIYDPQRKGLLMNPYKYPSSLLFDLHENSCGYEMGEYKSGIKDDRWSYRDKKRCIVVFKDGKYVPDTTIEGYSWDQDYFNNQNLRKHLVPIDPRELNVYPLDTENVEGLHSEPQQTQQGSPAMQIREEDIKNMVKNALNEIYGKRN